MAEVVTTAATVGGSDPRSGAARGVQSVDRALDILEVLSRAGSPLGVTDVATATGLPPGTVHRLLRSLQTRGYVRHDGDRKYSLGAAVFRLGDAARRSMASRARPHLEQLVAMTGETANLAVLEGDSVVYVAQAPSPHMLRMFAEVGRRVLPHSTAVGKAMLAHEPPEMVTALLRRTGLPKRTERTITTVEAFLDELARVRQRGFAVDDGEEDPSIRCMAVPVIAGRDVIAALSVSGPAERFTGFRDGDLPRRMREVAEEFAHELLSDANGGGRPAG